MKLQGAAFLTGMSTGIHKGPGPLFAGKMPFMDSGLIFLTQRTHRDIYRFYHLYRLKSHSLYDGMQSAGERGQKRSSV